MMISLLLTASSVELLLGTLVLTSNDQALSGMASSTNVFLTLTFRVRRLASSAWVTKRATETTTSTLWVNSMISSPRRVPLSAALPPQTVTTTLSQSLSVMESLWVWRLTRTTNTIFLKTVRRLGVPSLNLKACHGRKHRANKIFYVFDPERFVQQPGSCRMVSLSK